jgi:uncharacterized membrane protein
MSLHTLILIIHVFGAGMIIGVVLISLATVLKKPFSIESLGFISYIHKLGTIAAAVMLVTGLYLFFSEPEKFAANPVFWIKIVLYVCDGVVSGMLLKRKIVRLEKSKQSGSARGLTNIILVSVVIILLIASLGVILVES